MKVDIETLKDTFKLGYDAFYDSRKEAEEATNLFHNRQFTDKQLNTLASRGQPPETFNIIKMFTRMMLGYYSTVINTVKVNPMQEDDVIQAAVINDLIDFTFRDNNFDNEGDKIKQDGILAGIMAAYQVVVPTGEKDQFGRPQYRIELQHVPHNELVFDPMSRKEDYSDGRFIHRFKWLDEDTCIRLFGKAKTDELTANYNHLTISEAELAYVYNSDFNGTYKTFDNYLVVHTVLETSDGKVFSVFWSDDKILDKKEITYKKVKSPYRVQKIHASNIPEYYGIFREVIQTQHAINQALIKIQLMVNTQKAFVETNAVEDIDKFTDQFNRVNAVIPVKKLSGIKIENLTREVLDQYTIIDKALNRIQRILSINDSFLGMAYASDSGRKVKLQQNQSVIALSYFTNRVKQFYRLLGWDIMYLIQQYFTANQVFRIADNYDGAKWIEINKPLQVPTGRVNQQTGEPETRMVFEEVLDPENNKPMVDENGFIIVAPIPTYDTEISFTKADIDVTSVAYNDEDEKNQLMLETVINSQPGAMLAQMNPTGYFRVASLMVKGAKAKYSPEIAEIFMETMQMLQGNPQAQMAASQAGAQTGGGNMSSQLKLPQNTNEGF